MLNLNRNFLLVVLIAVFVSASVIATGNASWYNSVPDNSKDSYRETLESVFQRIRVLNNQQNVRWQVEADNLLAEIIDMEESPLFPATITAVGDMYSKVAQWGLANFCYELALSSENIDDRGYYIVKLKIAQTMRESKEIHDAAEAMLGLVQELKLRLIENETADDPALVKTFFELYLGSINEGIILLESLGSYLQAAVMLEEHLDFLLEYPTFEVEFPESVALLGYKDKRPLIDQCANLYKRAGLRENSQRVYERGASLIEDISVEDVLRFEFKKVRDNRSMTLEEKLKEAELILASMPEGNRKLEVMRAAAVFAKEASRNERRVELLHQIVEQGVVVDQSARQPTDFYMPLVWASALDLATHYLFIDRPQDAKKYLDILESECKNSRFPHYYEIAKRNNMWEWYDELMQREND